MNVPRTVEAIIYKSISRFTLTYVYESWVIHFKMKSKHKAPEMQILKRRRKKRVEQLWNEEIQNELQVIPFVERGQLRWYGHIYRTKVKSYLKKSLMSGNQQGTDQWETKNKVEKKNTMSK